MKRKLLYATTNPGKIFEVGKYLSQFGISLLSPKDIGANLNIQEEGKTLEENAEIKARAYLGAGPDFLVMSDDTGIEIDALGGEPGVRVRRWQDGQTRMADEEIIEYCLRRLAGVPPKKRGAQFRTVIALGLPGGEIEFFEGVLRGVIQEKPAPFRLEGFPFEPLFFVPEWGIVLGEAHRLPNEKKKKFLSHRERAVQAALPRIKQLLQAK